MSDDWYKRDVRKAIKGMVKLTLAERGAYNTIIDHQYLMGGPLPDDDNYLAGLMGCDVRTWRVVKRGLIAKDRIVIQGGFVADERANQTLIERETVRNKRSIAGQSGGIASGISRRNKALTEANASPPPNQIRKEEIREDAASPNGEAPRSAQEAITDACWAEGVPKLVSLGVPEPRARSTVGKWLKTSKPEDVLRAIEQASRNGTRDPIPLIVEILKPSDVRRNGKGWYVTKGSDEFEAWMRHALKTNDYKLQGRLKYASGEVQVPSRWPGGP